VVLVLVLGVVGFLGGVWGVLGLVGGLGGLFVVLNADVDESELDRVEAIILSMTPQERAHPGLINGSRRKRIANGSGTKVQQVNNLVKQFDQMRVLMKSMANGQMPTPQQMANLAGGGQRAPRPKARRR
jgi:signal recognition particle subunit SRP54